MSLLAYFLLPSASVGDGQGPRAADARTGEGDPQTRADRLAAALDAGGLGVWELDVGAGTVRLTALARRMLGIPAEQTPSLRTVLRRIHPDGRRDLAAVAAALRAPDASGEIDLRLPIRDPLDGPRWIAVRGRFAFAGSGPGRRPDDAIGTLRDVTEREELLRQKDALVAELNHRTKNSLQLVASLLRLESRDVKDPDGRRRFAEASTRVNSIAVVHGGLDRTDDLKRVRLGPLLRRLCQDLSHVHSRDDEVALGVAADVVLETDRAIPLAIIVNELVTNALKYGRPDPGPAVVQVALSHRCDGDLCLTVADGGAGLPAGFDVTRPHGLGLQLVTALTRQIGGRLDAESGEGGVTFRVVFPGCR